MTDPRARIRAIVESAPAVDDGGAGPPGGDDDDFGGHDDAHFPPGPPGEPGDGIDGAAVKECAKLDHSDTDNAKRLIAHFGRDLVAAARGGRAGGDWLGWTGRVWDRENGEARAVMTAQEVGGRIALEAAHLQASPAEQEILEAAEALAAADQSKPAKVLRADGAAIDEALKGRRRARWRFAVSSKNSGRIKSMLDMAAPRLRRPADGFNCDPLLLVTQTHTLRFVVEDDPECPDPDVSRKTARIEATAAFERGHYATGLVPSDYEPAAACPKWQAFLDKTMPDLLLRRTLQSYSGMGLIGVLAQRLMFHHGHGANGKSVFLAVLLGVIGPSLSLGLPKETVMGQGERGAGQASPDLVRLFGKRLVRIDELKEGEALREDLVKRLTGGDPMVVRDLFAGYLEFPNVATPHMSGNGFPKIDGTDNGIWRRMLVAHWSVTIPLEERRDFDELVADLLTERSGILNWLIAGALDYLANGLVVADVATQATAEYRAEMDPVSEFRTRSLVVAPGSKIQASRMYQAFRAWAKANGRSELSATRVGRELKKHLLRDETGSVRFYLDVELTDEAARLMIDHPPPAGGAEEEQR